MSTHEPDVTAEIRDRGSTRSVIKGGGGIINTSVDTLASFLPLTTRDCDIRYIDCDSEYLYGANGCKIVL